MENKELNKLKEHFKEEIKEIDVSNELYFKRGYKYKDYWIYELKNQQVNDFHYLPFLVQDDELYEYYCENMNEVIRTLKKLEDTNSFYLEKQLSEIETNAEWILTAINNIKHIPSIKENFEILDRKPSKD